MGKKKKMGEITRKVGELSAFYLQTTTRRLQLLTREGARRSFSSPRGSRDVMDSCQHADDE